MVLACPSNTKLKIKTDSQAAIDGLTTARNITSNRKWFGINNRSLINEIITIIKIKSLDIDIIKIKAHSGIEGNEIADELAKKGCKNSLAIDVDNNRLGTIRFIPTWHSHSIEQKIRKFISSTNSIYQQTLWSTNRSIRNYRFGGYSYSIEAAFLNIDETRAHK